MEISFEFVLKPFGLLQFLELAFGYFGESGSEGQPRELIFGRNQMKAVRVGGDELLDCGCSCLGVDATAA